MQSGDLGPCSTSKIHVFIEVEDYKGIWNALLPHRSFHSQRYLSPLCSIPCLPRNHSCPGEQALSLGSDYGGADEPPVLADHHNELGLQLWPTCWPAQVVDFALGTGLNGSVKIFWSIPPDTCYQAFNGNGSITLNKNLSILGSKDGEISHCWLDCKHHLKNSIIEIIHE